jgi:PhnB protein
MPELNGLIPHLTVDGATSAIDFYKQAFAADEIARHPADDGKRLMHAHLKVNGCDLFLNDAFPEYGEPAKPPASVTLALRVDDPDKWWKRAVAAGASVTMPLDDQFWGDRFGQLKDPFGHAWSISAPSKKK